MNMRTRLAQLRRVLDAAVDGFAPQLQHPERCVRGEEQARCCGDLARRREVNEVVGGVSGRGWEGRGERGWGWGVEDFVPEGWGGHFFGRLVGVGWVDFWFYGFTELVWRVPLELFVTFTG